MLKICIANCKYKKHNINYIVLQLQKISKILCFLSCGPPDSKILLQIIKLCEVLIIAGGDNYVFEELNKTAFPLFLPLNYNQSKFEFFLICAIFNAQYLW